MEKNKERTIVFDCETTGLSPKECSIVSIGGIDIASGDVFYEECQVHDNVSIVPQALVVNGFTNQQIHDKSKKYPEDILKDFEKFCKDHHAIFTAGFNVGFDINFLYNIDHEFGNDGIVPKTYDLMEISLNELIKNNAVFPLLEKEKIPNKYPKLDEALGYFGIPPEPHPHNGLNGAKLEAELYVLLKFGEHLLPNFKELAVPPAIKELDIDFAKYIHDTSSYIK